MKTNISMYALAVNNLSLTYPAHSCVERSIRSNLNFTVLFISFFLFSFRAGVERTCTIVSV